MKQFQRTLLNLISPRMFSRASPRPATVATVPCQNNNQTMQPGTTACCSPLLPEEPDETGWHWCYQRFEVSASANWKNNQRNASHKWLLASNSEQYTDWWARTSKWAWRIWVGFQNFENKSRTLRIRGWSWDRWRRRAADCEQFCWRQDIWGCIIIRKNKCMYTYIHTYI